MWPSLVRSFCTTIAMNIYALLPGPASSGPACFRAPKWRVLAPAVVLQEETTHKHTPHTLSVWQIKCASLNGCCCSRAQMLFKQNFGFVIVYTETPRTWPFEPEKSNIQKPGKSKCQTHPLQPSIIASINNPHRWPLVSWFMLCQLARIVAIAAMHGRKNRLQSNAIKHYPLLTHTQSCTQFNDWFEFNCFQLFCGMQISQTLDCPLVRGINKQ